MTRYASLLALALALFAGPAAAQSGATLNLGPQYYSYKVSTPINLSISEVAAPIAVVVPVFSKLTVEVATAWASAELKNDSATISKIQGLTDTQLRGNLVLGRDAIVLTAGLNLPTGSEQVTQYQLAAAGQIGNDFFAFPISNMGTGMATTGGIGIARPLGNWNLGLGASFRHADNYQPFDTIPGTKPFVYQPGDEYRARLGLDRVVGQGVLSFGLTYSAFGDDEITQDSLSAYSSGNRFVGQWGLSLPSGTRTLSISGWDLYRMEGTRSDGIAPPENILNLNASLAFQMGNHRIEPSVEVRHWLSEGRQQGLLGTFGLRTQFTAGRLTLSPSGGYTMGSYSPDVHSGAGFVAGTSSDVTGWRAVLGVRLER